MKTTLLGSRLERCGLFRRLGAQAPAPLGAPEPPGVRGEGHRRQARRGTGGASNRRPEVVTGTAAAVTFLVLVLVPEVDGGRVERERHRRVGAASDLVRRDVDV